MRNLRWVVPLLATAGLLCAADAPQEVTEAAGNNAVVNWSRGLVVAKGFAPKPARLTAPNHVLQRRAATIDAYRQLAEAVKGVHVSSETTIEMMELASDVVRTKVDAVLKGFAVLEEGWEPDRTTYRVTIAIALFPRHEGEESLMTAVVPSQAAVESVLTKEAADGTPPVVTRSIEVPAEQPDPDQPLPERKAGPYTGLVVDTTGFQVERAMAPRILQRDETPIWGHVPVDPDLVKKVGIVGYAPSLDVALDPARSRVGKNPLVVRAIGREGAFKANVVIEDAEGELVRRENDSLKPKDRFLENLRVVFVVDAD